jgi:hypothetical protein
LRGEINRNERPEAGLDIRDKKDEPIKSAQALRGRRQRRRGGIRTIKRRRSGFIGARAVVVSIVAEAA